MPLADDSNLAGPTPLACLTGTLAGASQADLPALRQRLVGEQAQASQVLAELQAALASTDQAGQRDLFRQVTGKSSMEVAADDLRSMLECYDRLIAQVDRRLAEFDAPPVPLTLRRENPPAPAAGSSRRTKWG